MKYVFTRPQSGVVYGVVSPSEGTAVDLDIEFAADGVASGLLKPADDEPVKDDAPKRGRPRKAE